MTTKQAMRPSEELLAMRELLAGEQAPGLTAVHFRWRVTRAEYVSNDAYWFLRGQCESSMTDWSAGKSNLEVIELIERAVLAAQKEEEGL